jgi:hypothetical protein
MVINGHIWLLIMANGYKWWFSWLVDGWTWRFNHPMSRDLIKMGLAKMMTNHRFLLARTHRMTSNAGKRIGINGIKCLRVVG